MRRVMRRMIRRRMPRAMRHVANTSPSRSRLRALCGRALAALAGVGLAAAAGLGGAAPVLVAPLATAGCTVPTDCECGDGAIRIRVAQDRAASVSSVSLSGEACAGVRPTCEQTASSGGCALYAFRPVATGSCSVNVVFLDGQASLAAVSVVAADACCGGFAPRNRADAEIEVRGAAIAGALAGAR
jgi:hypothetical protein